MTKSEPLEALRFRLSQLDRLQYGGTTTARYQCSGNVLLIDLSAQQAFEFLLCFRSADEAETENSEHLRIGFRMF